MAEPREAEKEPVLRFRNYVPQDQTLPHARIEATRVPKPDVALARAAIPAAAANPLLNLAPRNPNWDLQRDIEKDLAKLDRQTEVAIIELLRRKIAQAETQAGQPVTDLAAAVREQERAERKVDDDE